MVTNTAFILWLNACFLALGLVASSCGKSKGSGAAPTPAACSADQQRDTDTGVCQMPAPSCKSNEEFRNGLCQSLSVPACQEQGLSLNLEQTACVVPEAADCAARQQELREGRCQDIKPLPLPPPPLVGPSEEDCRNRGLVLNDAKNACRAPSEAECTARDLELRDARCQNRMTIPGPTENDCIGRGLILNAENNDCSEPTVAECLARDQVFREGKCQAIEPRQVRKMAILGDSIATGILSNTRLGKFPTISIGLPQVTIDFGDGFTVSASLFEVEENVIVSKIKGLAEAYKKRASAFFGGIDLAEDVKSHALQLGLPSKDVLHLAGIGYQASDVLQSIEDNAQKLAEVDYVVVEVGANDFCSNGDSETIKNNFKQDYEKIITKLRNLSSKPVVLVVPIPNVPVALNRIKEETALKIMNQPVLCEKFQAAYCPRVGDSLSEQIKLVQELNSIISELVRKSEAPERIILNESLQSATLLNDHFAADCFHPSKAGQQQISDLTFTTIKKYLKVRSSQ